MNIERLDTIRAILSEMKQMADEALCAPEPTQSNDLMPLLTEATELEEGYEDVPE